MQSILISLFYATILLSAAGIIVWGLLRFCGCRSPKIHGLAWALVLLQGVLWFRLSLDLPILEPEKPPTPTPIAVHVPETLQTQPQIPFRNYDAPIRRSNDFIAKTFYEPDFKAPEPEKETVSHTEPLVPVENSKPAKKWFFVLKIDAVFYAWLLGLIFLAGRQTVLYGIMLRQLKTAELPTEFMQQEWNTILRSQGLTPGRIRLLITDTMGPGLVKLPRFCAVVVPRSLWEESDASMRSGILKHEISHYRHGDLLKSCVFRLIGMIHWFNPIAWLALRRFENALEWRADCESFGTYDDGCVDFAKTLLAFRDTVPVTALCRRDFLGNNLIERSKRLLEFRQNQQGDSLMKKSFIIFCATLLLCCGLFRISLTPRGIAEEPKATVTQTVVTPPAKAKAEKPKSSNQARVKVRGKIVLPNGSPAVGMKVLVMGVSKTYPGSSGISNSESQSDGTFTINSFPEADYMISVFDSKGRFAAASQYYSVENETEYAKELVFQMENGVKVEGTVVEVNSGKPIPDVEMAVAFHEDEGTSRSTFFNIVADKNGKYHFATTKDHVVSVNIGRLPIHRGPGNASTEEKFLQQVDFSEISDVNGVPTVNMDFRIPAPFVGRVLNSDGSPASQIHVGISPSKPWHILDSKGNSTKTDANGYFRLPEQPKHVVVSISSKDVYMNWFKDDLLKEGTFEFRLKDPCGITGRLVDSETKKPLANQLLLLERSSKENPQLLDFMSQWTSTDNQGNFNIEDAVDNVRYELYVVPGQQRHYRGMPQSPRVTLKTVIPEKPGEKLELGDLEVDLTKAVVREEPGQIFAEKDDQRKIMEGGKKSGPLDPVRVKVRGKILLPDGSPATGMRIMSTGYSKFPLHSSSASNSYSQSDGRFSVNSFPNMNYMISVFDPKGRFAAAPQYYSVENEAVYAQELTFQMEDGVKVEGTVVQENNNKFIPDLKMSISFDSKKDSMRRTYFDIRTDQNGKYHFATTQDCDVYVNIGSSPISKAIVEMKDSLAEKHGFSSQKRLVQKVDFSGISNVNGVSTVKMGIRVPAPFVGRVLKSDGKPAAGARIQILSSRPRSISALPGEFITADLEGYFRIMERPKYVFVSITYGSFLQEVYTNWFNDGLPKDGSLEFRLKKPCGITGRLIDSATKKPLANQLLLLERSSKENPEILDHASQWTYTDDKGKFSVRDTVDNVRYELYVVPGLQRHYGGMPGSPRVTLKTVMSEKPGEKIDLGDLEVDFTKTVVKETPGFRIPDQDGWQTKLFTEQIEKVTSGEKKSVMKIYVKKEAQPAVDYILENADKEPLASFALFVVPFEKLSEEGQKQQDIAFESDHIEFKGEPLYLANDPILAAEPAGIMSLSQLRGESDSKWNVPKDDASQNGDWKKTPGAINPKILDNFLRDMIEKK